MRRSSSTASHGSKAAATSRWQTRVDQWKASRRPQYLTRSLRVRIVSLRTGIQEVRQTCCQLLDAGGGCKVRRMAMYRSASNTDGLKECFGRRPLHESDTYTMYIFLHRGELEEHFDRRLGMLELISVCGLMSKSNLAWKCGMCGEARREPPPLWPEVACQLI